MTTHWKIPYEAYENRWSNSNARSICGELKEDFRIALLNNFQVYFGNQAKLNEWLAAVKTAH